MPFPALARFHTDPAWLVDDQLGHIVAGEEGASGAALC
jgi:hypothetical protein